MPAGWAGRVLIASGRALNLSYRCCDGVARAGETSRAAVGRAVWVSGAAVGAGCDWDVVQCEGAFSAQVAAEGEPPAEDGADAVAVAGEEADVDEQPDPPAGEAAEVHPERRDDGFAAGDVGGRAQVTVLERLAEVLPAGLVGDFAPGVQPGLHS